MAGNWILDVSGDPVFEPDIIKWVKWFETSGDARVVAKTKVGEVEVSTVFLSVDHNFGSGQPILYETLVFGGPLDEECDRYPTKADARRGHEEMVKRVWADVPRAT